MRGGRPPSPPLVSSRLAGKGDHGCVGSFSIKLEFECHTCSKGKRQANVLVMAHLAFLCDEEACRRFEDVVGATMHLLDRAKRMEGSTWTYRFVSATTCPTAHEQCVRQARKAARAGRASRTYWPVEKNLMEEMGGISRTMGRLVEGGEYTADSTPCHLLHGIVRALADVAAHEVQADIAAERDIRKERDGSFQDFQEAEVGRTDVYIFANVLNLAKADPAQAEQLRKIVESSHLQCYFVNVIGMPAETDLPSDVQDLILRVGGKLIELPACTRDRVRFFQEFRARACTGLKCAASVENERVNLIVQHSSCSVQWLPPRSDFPMPSASNISKIIVAGLLSSPVSLRVLEENPIFVVSNGRGEGLFSALMLHLCEANLKALLHLKGENGTGARYGLLEAHSEQVGIVHLAPPNANLPPGILPVQLASRSSSMAFPCDLNDLLEVPSHRDAVRPGQWKSVPQSEGQRKEIVPDLPSAIQQDGNVLRDDKDQGISSVFNSKQGPPGQISGGLVAASVGAKAKRRRQERGSESNSTDALKQQNQLARDPCQPKRPRLSCGLQTTIHKSMDEVAAWVKSTTQRVVDNLVSEIQSVETTREWVSKSMEIAESAEHIVSVAIHSGREIGEVESGNSPGQSNAMAAISARVPGKLSDLDSYVKGKEGCTNLKIAWTFFQVFLRFELSIMPSVQDPMPKSRRKQVISLLSSVVFELPDMEEGLKELCDHVLIPRYGMILPTTLDMLYDRLGFKDVGEEEESWAIPAELPVHNAQRAFPSQHNQQTIQELERATVKPVAPMKERGQFSRGRANLQRTATVKVRRKAAEADLKMCRPRAVTHKTHVQVQRKPSFPTMCGTPRTEYADYLPPPAPKLVRNGRSGKSQWQSPGVGCSQPAVLETPLHARPRALEFVLEPTPCRMEPFLGPRPGNDPPFVCQRVLFGSP